MHLTSLKTWKYNVPKTLNSRTVVAPSNFRSPFGKKTDKELTDLSIKNLEASLNHGGSGNTALFYSEPAF
jgi:hypothetical protein